MALDFGTVSDNYYVDCGNMGSWNPASGGFSIVTWIYPTGWGTDAWFITKTSAWRGFYLNAETNDSKIHMLRAGTSFCFARSNTGFLTLNIWNFVAGCLDLDGASTAQHIYHGTLSSLMSEVTYSSRGAGSGYDDISSATLRFGRGDPANTYMAGNIAFVAIFDKQLSLTECQMIQYFPLRCINIGNLKGFWFLGFTGTGTQPDLSGNAYNGTVTGCSLADHVPLGMPFGFAKVLDQYVPPVGITIPIISKDNIHSAVFGGQVITG